MNYRNLEMKLDQFVTYVNDGKINLIPPFQRGQVWKLPMRQKLIENVIKGRPIPAIFLYKEATGDKYAYNILDGKQRLESLMLFIGNQREALKIPGIHNFFMEPQIRSMRHFKVDFGSGKKGLADLDENLFRDFQEYVIPTIEITMTDDGGTALDEMISLFVDINSFGVQVKRFDIVKAMLDGDALLRSTFGLIAEKQKRSKDIYYRAKGSSFTKVLKRLQVVENLSSANARVDRMWELLVEIVLFFRTKVHRNPVEILKSFIRAAESRQPKVTKLEQSRLRFVFDFLYTAYSQGVGQTRLATNQIHFYTMVTAIIKDDLVNAMDAKVLTRKLMTLGKLIELNATEKPSSLAIKKQLKVYRELSEKQTTHSSRREERVDRFLELLGVL